MWIVNDFTVECSNCKSKNNYEDVTDMRGNTDRRCKACGHTKRIMTMTTSCFPDNNTFNQYVAVPPKEKVHTF